jgi:hypothetical protein
MGTLKMTPVTRIQEWLADRVSWVQYPKVKFYDPIALSARVKLALLILGICLIPVVAGVIAGLLDATRANPAFAAEPGKYSFAYKVCYTVFTVHCGRP